jgi:hypothetical protein
VSTSSLLTPAALSHHLVPHGDGEDEDQQSQGCISSTVAEGAGYVVRADCTADGSQSGSRED